MEYRELSRVNPGRRLEGGRCKTAVREAVPKEKKTSSSIWAWSHSLEYSDKQPREGEQSTVQFGPICQPLTSPGSSTPAEESQVPKAPPESPAPPSRPLPPQSLEGLEPAEPETGALERAPIQNSPWKETSLDHPYEKPRKSSEPNSESRSGWGGKRVGSRWELCLAGGGVQQGKVWETAPLLNCGMVGGMSFGDPLPLYPPSSAQLEPHNGGILATDLSLILFQQPSHHAPGWAQHLQPLAAGACLLPCGSHPQPSWPAAGPHQCPSHPRDPRQEGPVSVSEVRGHPRGAGGWGPTLESLHFGVGGF